MALHDLLWACPLCGLEGGIRPEQRREVCQGCGTRYRRGRDASITAETPGRPALTLSPAEWVDRLPAIDIEKRIREAADRAGVIKDEPATLRLVEGNTPVYFRGRYLNRIERFGEEHEGILQLRTDSIIFLPYLPQEEATSANGAIPRQPPSGFGGIDNQPPTVSWDLDRITAVQPSSSTLQLNARGLPLASLEIPNGSIRLWEELICGLLRYHYRMTGRGEIVEFQPRIATSQVS